MQFDPRLTTLGISAVPNANATWVVTSVQYQDETQAGGNHNIFFTVQDDQGKPAPNITCVVDWVGRDPTDPPTKVVTDANGLANVPIYANLDIHLLNGPYFAFIEDQSKSDVVKGMGLPEHHHVNFLLTFKKSSGLPTPERAAIAAASQLYWMPINTNAALYKFAQTQNLGYPQTDEFQFMWNGATYIGQVFNLGIVYVKQGDWGNVQWVKKPGQ